MGDPLANAPYVEVRAVPRVEGLTEAEEAEGVRRYQQQKKERRVQSTLDEAKRVSEEHTGRQAALLSTMLPDATPNSVRASTSQLVQLMLPSDCTSNGTVFGGVVMKLMDNAAGVCAVRHCRSNVVTASLDALDFIAPIHNGDIVHVTATPLFTSGRSMEVKCEARCTHTTHVLPQSPHPTSSLCVGCVRSMLTCLHPPRSLPAHLNSPGLPLPPLAPFAPLTPHCVRLPQIEVLVEAESLSDGTRVPTTRGILTFVSLSQERRTQPLPHLVTETDWEKTQFALGEQRYELRKAARRAARAAKEAKAATEAGEGEEGKVAKEA